MTEVYYLPLKSAGGTILGHARISGGIARLQLRRPVHGQAVILSENGSASGEIQEEIGVHGKLSAIAVLEEGRLLCCGIPQGQTQSFADLKKQLERTQAKPLPTPPPPTAAAGAIDATRLPTAPTAAQPTTPAAQPMQREPDPPQETEIPIPPDAKACAPKGDIPVPLPIGMEPSALPQDDGIPTDAAAPLLLFDGRDGLHEKPSLADSAADSEAFAALLRRAELVFESIEAPHPPLLTGGKRSAAGRSLSAAAEAEPHITPVPRGAAGTAAQRNWGQEVELLLGERPAERKTAVENPFPHIFPNAVFHRISGSGVQPHLEGDWQNGGEHLRIHAVPGTYSPQPPAHLKGYTRFIRTLQGSYWVRVSGLR